MFAFRAMNTDVAVTASGDEAAIAVEVADTFARAERRFSRFRDDSELSRLNRASGRVAVSAELFDALERARGYLLLTDGLFDPGIGGLLTALGYDRSFASGALDREGAAPLPATGSFRDVELDAATRSVQRPGHVQLDLGGMIKGATVDAAAGHLRGSGAIDAGGDAFMVGEWLVDVEVPKIRHASSPASSCATLRSRRAPRTAAAGGWAAGRRII